MPLDQQLETKSPELQKELTTPPNFVITWGSSVITLIIFTGLLFISSVSLPARRSVPFTGLLHCIPGKSNKLSINVEPTFFPMIRSLHVINLDINNDPQYPTTKVCARVDTIILSNEKVIIFLQVSGSACNDIHVKNGQSGNISFQIGESSLFKTFMEGSKSKN